MKEIIYLQQTDGGTTVSNNGNGSYGASTQPLMGSSGGPQYPVINQEPQRRNSGSVRGEKTS